MQPCSQRPARLLSEEMQAEPRPRDEYANPARPCAHDAGHHLAERRHRRPSGPAGDLGADQRSE